MKFNLRLLNVAVMAGLMMTSGVSQACSRFTYVGANNSVVTGRSMDWVEDLKSDLWAFPAGATRVGSAQANSVTWKAKYGSVIASAYAMGTTDGINTQGLVANLLYLSTSDYGKPDPARQNISIFTWAQYVLDNYATVAEAVSDYGQDKFNMTATKLPNGFYPTVHLAISDKSGDNAIFEYINGKLTVHHNKAYNVMTNEPAYDKQLALNDYWQNLKGAFLPGTIEPEDRFVRASYYVKEAPSVSGVEAIATTFSIIRNVSVPYGKSAPGRPNVSKTIWRSVADVSNLVYYFENTDRPNIFWVDLAKLDLSENGSTKKLPLQHGEIYAGEVSGKFVDSASFLK